MKVKLKAILFPGLIGLLASCANVHQIHELPDSAFTISEVRLAENARPVKNTLQKGAIAELDLSDTTLFIQALAPVAFTQTLPLQEIEALHFYRRTFDVDILTIPFKIRPSVADFPEQLNANFSAALYLGYRKDRYHLKKTKRAHVNRVQVSGLGLGYGGFIGIGAVTMNSFVTKNAIAYDYDGLVLTGGGAVIYDVKKINLGLAVGVDYLTDKNRHAWIYQKKPWFGLLLSINLN